MYKYEQGSTEKLHNIYGVREPRLLLEVNIEFTNNQRWMPNEFMILYAEKSPKKNTQSKDNNY